MYINTTLWNITERHLRSPFKSLFLFLYSALSLKYRITKLTLCTSVRRSFMMSLLSGWQISLHLQLRFIVFKSTPSELLFLRIYNWQVVSIMNVIAFSNDMLFKHFNPPSTNIICCPPQILMQGKTKLIYSCMELSG